MSHVARPLDECAAEAVLGSVHHDEGARHAAVVHQVGFFVEFIHDVADFELLASGPVVDAILAATVTFPVQQVASLIKLEDVDTYHYLAVGCVAIIAVNGVDGVVGVLKLVL